MPSNPKNMSAEQLQAPWINHTAATNGTYDPPLRGLYVSVGGTCDLTDLAGTTLTTVTLVAGSVWPGCIATIANIAGGLVMYSGR